jgi:protein-tyrosine phosphatase
MMQLGEPKRLLECAPNFRDIGGYPTEDGRKVRSGLIFRSQMVVGPSAADIDMLGDIGIRYICDLRGAREAEQAPCHWPTGVACETRKLDIGADVRAGAELLLDIIVADPTEVGIRRMMLATYSLLPLSFQGKLGVVLDDLVSGDRFPAVIHCTAGKDRTGFTIAILLLTLGAPMEIVRHDYMLTARYLDIARMMAASAGYLKSVVGDRVTPSEAMLRMLCGVHQDYLDAAIGAVMRDYDSVEGYLEKTAGFNAAKRERLRELLLE